MCKARGVIREGSEIFPIVEEFEVNKREIRCADYCKLLKLTNIKLPIITFIPHRIAEPSKQPNWFSSEVYIYCNQRGKTEIILSS